MALNDKVPEGIPGESARERPSGSDGGDGGGHPFDRLLSALDEDRDRAGVSYERLRKKLVAFFDWRGASVPEELADRTLDRVAQKISNGELTGSLDLARYAHGVGKNVLREHWTERSRETTTLRRLQFEPSRSPGAAARHESELAERRSNCLDGCLSRLAPRSRNLLLSYYSGEKHGKIVQREGLANELGITLNALRTRCFRLRESLEACVDRCLRETPGKPIPDVSHKPSVTTS